MCRLMAGAPHRREHALAFHLGDAFRKARELRRWKVVDLAERAGVDKNTVVRIERNGGTDESRAKVAAALGYTLDELRAAVQPPERPITDDVEIAALHLEHLAESLRQARGPTAARYLPTAGRRKRAGSS